MTTTDRPEAIPVSDRSWVAGGSKKRAYVSPWFVATLKHASFDNQQGTLASPFVEHVVATLHGYVPESVER